MIMIIAFVLVVVCLPSLMGALLRLAAPSVEIYKISLGVGIFFAILRESVDSSGHGLVSTIDLVQKMTTSHEILGVWIIVIVMIDVGIFAALATLGVDFVDRRKCKRAKSE